MGDDTAGGFSIPSWYWWLGLGLAASVVLLMVLWYVKHPDRSVFEDFAPRHDLGAPETNGHFPTSPSEARVPLESRPGQSETG